MNSISKPFLFNILLVVCFALFLSQLSGLFIKTNFAQFIEKTVKNSDTKFDIVKSMNIQNKKIVQQTTTIQTSGVFLLKDFSISAIILDGKNSMIIVRDNGGGKFLSIGDIHKGYKLTNVYEKKAKFTKNVDTYFAFLTPEDEKNFQGVAKKTIVNNTASRREVVTGTTSRNMFEDIKYKNGKYFIPKDTLLEYASLRKIFSGISIGTFIENDKIRFRVNHISNSSIFKKMGLKKYDFITQINGADFKSMSEPLKYFENLKNIKELALSIKRGNETKELKYEIY